MTKVLQQKIFRRMVLSRGEKHFHWGTGHIHEIKRNFGIEKYLNTLSFAYRRDVAILRISSHRINIEVGRYTKTDRADRLCTKCSLVVLGIEVHFLLECPNYSSSRESLIRLIHDECKTFIKMDSFTKYIWLLNCENVKIMHELANSLI